MRLVVVSTLIFVTLGTSACSTSVNVGSTGCQVDGSIACPTGAVGYSCSGSSYPTNNGQVCNTDGSGSWCCYASACAPDPSINTCVANTYGYSCAPGEPPPDTTDPSLICSVPLVTNGVDEYCCATSVPVSGASCGQDFSISGCAAGSYGFSCTGSDRPDQDYSGITCSQSATSGANASGQSALLYCCAYNSSGAGIGTGNGTNVGSDVTCTASYQKPANGESCGNGCDACLQTYACGPQYKACDSTCKSALQAMMSCTQSAAASNGGNLTSDLESACSTNTLGPTNSPAYTLWWQVIRVSLDCSIPCCALF